MRGCDRWAGPGAAGVGEGVSLCDSATRPSGSRTASAFGCRAVSVKPTTVASAVSACHWRSAVIRKLQYSPGGCHRASAGETLHQGPWHARWAVRPLDQHRHVDTSQTSDPAVAVARACALHALNEISKGVAPGPAAAVVTIARPGGTVLGHFTAVGQDAENAAQRRAVRNGSWSCATCTVTARSCATCLRSARRTRGRPFSTPPCERIRVRVQALGSGSPCRDLSHGVVTTTVTTKLKGRGM